jgi:transposase IS116/IS110/IS902 family protein
VPRTRTRAARRAPVQHPNRQYHRPEVRTPLAYQANRAGVAARVRDPAVQKHVAVELARIAYDDPLLNDVELTSVQTAQPHAAQPLSRRPSGPGIGKIVRVVWLDEMHDITRFPQVQEVVSYGRLVTWAQEAAGTRDGTSGAKVGQASLTWAFSEATVLGLRNHPAGQPYLARVERTQGQGKAWTVWAPKLARAVYDLRKRDPVCARHQFRNGSWSGAGEPHASLDAHGLRLTSGALLISLRQRTRRSTSVLWP